LPSVEIQRRPCASIAQLSGMPNQPFFVVSDEKLAPTSLIEGSPQRTSTSQRKSRLRGRRPPAPSR
jgi:hypothetical protein